VTRYQIHGDATLSRKVVSISFGLSVLRKFIYVAALGFGSAVIQTAAATESDFSIGNKLADMLRASRSVVSASQGLINDPDIGDKGFTGEKLVREAEAIYAERVGTPLFVGDLSERDRRRQSLENIVMTRWLPITLSEHYRVSQE